MMLSHDAEDGCLMYDDEMRERERDAKERERERDTLRHA